MRSGTAMPRSADQPQALQLGLHHQQAVEDEVFRAAVGVAVDPRQVLHRKGVLGADGEFAESLPQQARGWAGSASRLAVPAGSRLGSMAHQSRSWVSTSRGWGW